MNGTFTHFRKKSPGFKYVFLMLAMLLVIGCTIGGTLAWLTAKTSDVENTFVAGQIGTLSLTETDTDSVQEGVQHQYIVIPGKDISKDPKVIYTPTAEEGTVPVDAYVFVVAAGIREGKWTWNAESSQYEIVNNNNEAVMSFKIANGWTTLANSGVFYREIKNTDEISQDGWPIIEGNQISVSELITEEDVVAIAAAADELTFTAYAIQQEGFENATQAWMTLYDNPEFVAADNEATNVLANGD